ncbi:MAG: DUF262 domain-containing protein [Proteobacteria bacterium]|nr:DUF262 domain-containing protein [Pseudomonadota bacterium]
MEANPTTYPITWFKDRNLEKSLRLKPPYQRKPVWTDVQKAYLIDTILKNYHIPEIYIHREVDKDGKAIYNIVDGQQRIRSILEFIDGEFSLSQKFNPEYADYGFNDLPENVKKDLWNYTIYAREIVNAKEEEVRSYFMRLNRFVVPLNPQELRHATYSGEFIRLMEELAEEEFWAENKIVTPNEIRRMIDVQFISELFISMINGIQDKTKELDQFYRLYEPDFPEKNKWKRFFQNIIDTIIKLFPYLKESRWKNKSDFYTLFMALRQALEHNYIPENKREKLRSELKEFSEKINEATKKENKGKRFPKDVLIYSNAVTKSTTDKDRRLSRHKIVLAIILKHTKQIVSKELVSVYNIIEK